MVFVSGAYAGLTLTLQKRLQSVKSFSKCFTTGDCRPGLALDSRTYGRLLSVTMLKHADGLEIERLREQWHLQVQA